MVRVLGIGGFVSKARNPKTGRDLNARVHRLEIKA